MASPKSKRQGPDPVQCFITPRKSTEGHFPVHALQGWSSVLVLSPCWDLSRQLGHPLTEGVDQNNFIKLQVRRLGLLMFTNPTRTAAGSQIVIVLLAVHALRRELLFF